jgi:hypothetical protein
VNLRFNVSLTDIAVGLETLDGGKDEQQELMDFLISVGGSVSDADFSRELIYRLAEDFTFVSEGFGQANISLKGKGGVTSIHKTLPKLAEDLSYVDEEHLIVLMADAIFRKRERERGRERERKRAERTKKVQE